MDQQRGRVAQINVNPAGGVPKHRVESARLTTQGVAGDRQRDREHHGGPLRAVSLYALERIEELRAEGHPIAPGSTGENLMVAGIDWDSLVPGVVLRVGAARIAITSYATPCNNIAGSFSDGRSVRIGQKLHPGWSRLYARVLDEAVVREGDLVVLEEPAA